MCKFINIISVILDKINYLQKLKAIKSSRTIIYFKLSYIQHHYFFYILFKGNLLSLLFFILFYYIYIKKKIFYLFFIIIFIFILYFFYFTLLGSFEINNTSSNSATIPVLRRGLRRYDIQNKDFILIFIHDLQSWSVSKLCGNFLVNVFPIALK